MFLMTTMLIFERHDGARIFPGPCCLLNTGHRDNLTHLVKDDTIHVVTKEVFHIRTISFTKSASALKIAGAGFFIYTNDKRRFHSL